MAAIHAAVRWCAPTAGSTVFVSQDCYGGTFTLLSNTLAKEGGTVRFVEGFDLPELARRLAKERPAGPLLEIVSKPLQRGADLEAGLELGQQHDPPGLVAPT